LPNLKLFTSSFSGSSAEQIVVGLFGIPVKNFISAEYCRTLRVRSSNIYTCLVGKQDPPYTVNKRNSPVTQLA